MRGPTTNGFLRISELFHYRDKVQYMFYQMCKFYLAMAPHGPVFSRYVPLPFHRYFEPVFCHDVIVQLKSRDFTVGGTTALANERIASRCVLYLLRACIIALAVQNCILTPFLTFQPWPVRGYSYFPDPSFPACAYISACVYVRGRVWEPH